jgi:hypothetical protein
MRRYVAYSSEWLTRAAAGDPLLLVHMCVLLCCLAGGAHVTSGLDQRIQLRY